MVSCVAKCADIKSTSLNPAHPRVRACSHALGDPSLVIWNDWYSQDVPVHLSTTHTTTADIGTFKSVEISKSGRPLMESPWNIEEE
jgi:hypothetical protein